MVKLIAAYIGDNCANTLEMSLDSVIKHVDHIVFVWGMKCPDTYKILCDYKQKHKTTFTLIKRKFEHEHPGANGRARNTYLDYIKDKFQGEFCLVLDPDEVCDKKIMNIKKEIKELKNNTVSTDNVMLSPNMEHFIGDLKHIDTTQPKHYCLNRFFKITKDLIYPEVEHPVLSLKKEGVYISHNIEWFTIWHMAYCNEMFSVLKRYDNHMKKSNMHSPQYLRNWFLQHINGSYPKKEIQLSELPMIIKEKFHLERIGEEEYFANRSQVEVKHFLMVKQWVDHFRPLRVLDCGCGMGHYLYAFKQFGVDGDGFEFSQYAVDNRPYQDINVVQGDVLTYKTDTFYDLVTVLDVLEHISYDDIDGVLENIKKLGKTILTSIPYIGDPNLESDASHLIKETKEWWIKKFTEHGFIVEDVPVHFHFAHQMLVLRND